MAQTQYDDLRDFEAGTFTHEGDSKTVRAPVRRSS